MVYGAVIKEMNHPMLTCICDLLKAKPGDQLLWEPQDDDTVKIRKAKQPDFAATFNTIDQLVRMNGGFEKVGLYNEDDVAEYIRELRRETSSS